MQLLANNKAFALITAHLLQLSNVTQESNLI